jgi:nitrite reductase/ring-hydroxylating ferredoxin subunit
VECNGLAIAVFALDDGWYATQDACTHGPGSLAEGWIEAGEVECPFHQGRFDIRSGQPTAPPCTAPLRTWPTRVIDGQVCIEWSHD